MSYGKTVSSVAAELLQSFSRTVWPEPCLGCRVEIGRSSSDRGPLASTPLRIGLCQRCRRLLKAKGWVCTRCGVELELDEPSGSERDRDGSRAPAPREALCSGCRRDPPPWRRLTWLWRYEPPLDSVIVALKFARLDYLGPRLGLSLAAALEGRAEEIDLVVPVPLHWTRRLRRGYDQAELIAGELARGLDRPLVKGLRRRRATKAQSHQDRGRRRVNLRSAFVARKDFEGLKVLLVDDVVTTGATLESATRALLEAGAELVDVATVGRTPEPGEPAGPMS